MKRSVVKIESEEISVGDFWSGDIFFKLRAEIFFFFDQTQQ
jgi:hypothetical protein